MVKRKKSNNKKSTKAAIDSAEIIFTEMKWLARATGAGYAHSELQFTNAIFGPFWDELPPGAMALMSHGGSDGDIPYMAVTQAQADVAYRSGLQAFRMITGKEPELPYCMDCGDINLINRRGNDYKCQSCGWTCEPGTYGATYLAMQAAKGASNVMILTL